MAVNLGQAVGYLDLDTSGFKRGFNSALKDLDTFKDRSLTLAQRTDALASAMTTAGRAATLNFTAPILAGFTAATVAGVKFESAFTGVIKTVDATDVQLAQLRQEIIAMSKVMPQTASEIAAVAEAAGQLGIKTENIAAFTRTMIMLGDATNLTSTTAATVLARFANITGMAQTDFDKLGSAIVQLGNNLATTEAEIADMALNIAAAGTQAGLTEAEILALAGALSSVGLESARGGTAISRVIKQMQVAVETGNEDLTNFARVANMTAEQFAKAFKDDAAGALLAFTSGLNDTDRLGASAIQTLEQMGFTEIRVSDALLRAAGASEVFADSLAMSKSAWQANVALSREAELRYGTTESKLAILKNTVTAIGISFSDVMIPAIVKGLDWLTKMIDGFSNLDYETRQNIIAVAAFVAAIGPMLIIGGKVLSLFSAVGKLTTAGIATAKLYNTVISDGIATGKGFTSVLAGMKAAKLSDQAITTAAVTAQNLKNAADAKGVITANSLTFAEVAQAAAVGLASGQITLATAAQWLWNASILSNPILWFVAGIAAAVAGIISLISWMVKGTNANQDYKKEIKETNKELENLQTDISDSSKEFENQLPAIAAATKQTLSYTDKIEELMSALSEMNDEERLHSAQARELQVYISRLNESQDGLNLSYNAETNSLNKNIALVRQMIKEKQQVSTVNALNERAVEISQQLANVDAQLMVIAAQRVRINEDENLTIAERNNLLEQLELSEQNYVNTREEAAIMLQDITAAQVEAEAAVTETTIEGLAQQELALQALAEKWGVSVETIQTAMDEQGLSMTDWEMQQQEILSTLNESYAGYFDTVTNGFDRITQKATVSLDEFIAIMLENQQAVANWSTNIETLMAAGVDSGVIAQLQRLGPEGAAQAQRFVNELNTLNGGVDIGLGQINSTAAAKLQEITNTFDLGAQTAAEAAITEFNADQYISSGSRSLDDIALGMRENTAVTDAAVETVSDAETAAEKQVSLEDFPGVGYNMVAGIAGGVTSNQGILAGAMRSMINSAIAAARAEAQIHSPARRFGTEVGTFIPQGVAQFVLSGIHFVTDAIEEMMDAGLATAATSTIGFEENLADEVETKTPIRTIAQTENSPAPVQPIGDTYNFYGTQPLDEVETARRFKLTKQQLAADLLV